MYHNLIKAIICITLSSIFTEMASGGSNNNDRPYSLSKDEALARMLQEEEYDAAQHADEQLARQLQVCQIV